MDTVETSTTMRSTSEILLILCIYIDYEYETLFFEFSCFLRYVLAIAIISTVYTAWQTFVYLSKREFFDRRTSMLVDFSGDQVRKTM